jgi:hypothetical protein
MQLSCETVGSLPLAHQLNELPVIYTKILPENLPLGSLQPLHSLVRQQSTGNTCWMFVRLMAHICASRIAKAPHINPSALQLLVHFFFPEVLSCLWDLFFILRTKSITFLLFSRISLVKQKK